MKNWLAFTFINLLTLLCFFFSVKASANDCSSFYDDLYSDGLLEIDITYGYGDTVEDETDWVTDVISADAQIGRLTSKCNGGEPLCNFTRLTPHGEWPAKLVKDVPSGQIQIRIMISSASISNSDNKSKFLNEQKERSREAEQFYLTSISESEVSFYVGHSRDGGGPDFKPPKQYHGNSGVNYTWYRSHTPGLDVLLNHINTQPVSSRLVGLFSCASKVHFSNVLSKSLPDSSFILSTHVIPQKKVKEGLRTSLKALFNRTCLESVNLRANNFEYLD